MVFGFGIPLCIIYYYYNNMSCVRPTCPASLRPVIVIRNILLHFETINNNLLQTY